jgi:hypothetical protein
MAFVSPPHPWPQYVETGNNYLRITAGCGKSVLASSIIDALAATNLVAFYYCDYADKRALDPANLFGTLARQLLDNVEIVPESLACAIEAAAHDGDQLTDQSIALKFF